MKKTLVFVATLLVSAGLAQIANAAEAQPFQITLPTGFGAFTNQTQTAKDPSGKDIKVSNWISKSPSGEAVVVSVSKMPAKIDDATKLMDGSRDSLLKSVNGTIDTQKTLDGTMPAIAFDFHSGTAAFLRAKLMVEGDSLYQLLYVGRTADQRANPSVDGLFQSFAINVPTQAAAATTTAPATTTAH